MNKSSYMHILSRTGKVLIAIGGIDIGVMIYCISNGIPYSSSLNIFSVIAGIFLLRGSLRAASLVRWLSVFTLCAFAALAVAWPLLQPFDLTLTQVRLTPGSSLLSLALLAFFCALLYWLAKTLGGAPILEARIAAGRKQRNMLVPAIAGVVLVVVLSAFMSFLLRGEAAMKALQMAQQKIGAGYKFHVSSLNIASGSKGTTVRGMVTAWNSSEILNVPVGWQEP